MSADDSKDLFEKIGVADRGKTPLRSESALILGNRVYDRRSTNTLPAELSESIEQKK